MLSRLSHNGPVRVEPLAARKPKASRLALAFAEEVVTLGLPAVASLAGPWSLAAGTLASTVASSGPPRWKSALAATALGVGTLLAAPVVGSVAALALAGVATTGLAVRGLFQRLEADPVSLDPQLFSHKMTESLQAQLAQRGLNLQLCRAADSAAAAVVQAIPHLGAPAVVALADQIGRSLVPNTPELSQALRQNQPGRAANSEERNRVGPIPDEVHLEVIRGEALAKADVLNLYVDESFLDQSSKAALAFTVGHELKHLKDYDSAGRLGRLTLSKQLAQAMQESDSLEELQDAHQALKLCNLSASLLSHDTESQADRQGYLWARKLGFDHQQILQGVSEVLGSSQTPGQEHPAAADRIQSLQREFG